MEKIVNLGNLGIEVHLVKWYIAAIGNLGGMGMSFLLVRDIAKSWLAFGYLIATWQLIV